jgi:hypothetical protein
MKSLILTLISGVIFGLTLIAIYLNCQPQARRPAIITHQTEAAIIEYEVDTTFVQPDLSVTEGLYKFEKHPIDTIVRKISTSGGWDTIFHRHFYGEVDTLVRLTRPKVYYYSYMAR